MWTAGDEELACGIDQYSTTWLRASSEMNDMLHWAIKGKKVCTNRGKFFALLGGQGNLGRLSHTSVTTDLGQ